MKKIIFSFSLLFISSLIFSQEWKNYDWQKWKDYQLDEDVAIQTPSEIAVQNLQAGKVYSCPTSKGSYVVTISPPSENLQVSNRKELNERYSELINGYLDGSKGKLIVTRTVFKGELEGRSVRSSMHDINGTPIISEAHFYLLTDKMYLFRCVQIEDQYDSLDPGQKRFFDSVCFVKNPEVQAQFANPLPRKSGAEKLGHAVGYAFGTILVLAVMFLVVAGVILAIVLIIKKRNQSN